MKKLKSKIFILCSFLLLVFLIIYLQKDDTEIVSKKKDATFGYDKTYKLKVIEKTGEVFFNYNNNKYKLKEHIKYLPVNLEIETSENASVILDFTNIFSEEAYTEIEPNSDINFESLKQLKIDLKKGSLKLIAQDTGLKKNIAVNIDDMKIIFDIFKNIYLKKSDSGLRIFSDKKIIKTGKKTYKSLDIENNKKQIFLIKKGKIKAIDLTENEQYIIALDKLRSKMIKTYRAFLRDNPFSDKKTVKYRKGVHFTYDKETYKALAKDIYFLNGISATNEYIENELIPYGTKGSESKKAIEAVAWFEKTKNIFKSKPDGEKVVKEIERLQNLIITGEIRGTVLDILTKNSEN